MKIIGNTVILRDLCRGDIERRILWETQQTEWQQWDAPWEYEETGVQASLAWLEAYREHLESRVQELRWMDEQQLRRGFEIALASDSGKSIGWCNSYFLKDDLWRKTWGFRDLIEKEAFVKCAEKGTMH